VLGLRPSASCGPASIARKAGSQPASELPGFSRSYSSRKSVPSNVPLQNPAKPKV
jgi:hypothetical protein